MWGRAAGPHDALGCLKGTSVPRLWSWLPPSQYQRGSQGHQASPTPTLLSPHCLLPEGDADSFQTPSRLTLFPVCLISSSQTPFLALGGFFPPPPIPFPSSKHAQDSDAALGGCRQQTWTCSRETPYFPHPTFGVTNRVWRAPGTPYPSSSHTAAPSIPKPPGDGASGHSPASSGC